MLLQIFQEKGELLLPTVPSDSVPLPVSGLPELGEALIVVFILLCLLLLGNFINIVPHLADSILRARGSTALEGSVRVSRDRNLIALVFVIPAIILQYRYCLYYPEYVQSMTPTARLLVTGAVFIGYLLLRFLMYLWLKPRRSDAYMMSNRAGYSFYILLCLVAFLTLGVLLLFKASDLTVKGFLMTEVAVFYFIYFVRRGQILLTNCAPFTTFLYLCALEILPTGLFVASAVVL